MNLRLPGTKLLVLCFLLQCGLPSAAAGSTDPEGLASFLEEIKVAAAKVQSLHCAFTQEKHLALFARPVVFHGTLNLVRPDRLRWEFTSPVSSALIFNGASGLRCSDRAKPIRFDLRTDPVMQMVARQLWLWLDGNFPGLAEEYHLERAGADALAIRPRDPKIAEIITAVTISFAPDSKQPRLVEITDPGGDLTRIFFHDYQFNPAPDEELFNRCGDRE